MTWEVVLTAGVSALLYLIAVWQRGRAAVEVSRLRWWYVASIPLGVLLALNQVLVLCGTSLTEREQAAIRILVVSVVWIGPAVVGRMENRDEQ